MNPISYLCKNLEKNFEMQYSVWAHAHEPSFTSTHIIWIIIKGNFAYVAVPEDSLRKELQVTEELEVQYP